jgi:hypothetical protein
MRWTLALVIWLALTAPAAADGGGPFSAYQGYYGVRAPGGKSVYSALGLPGGRTLVERVDRTTGGVLAYKVLHGSYGVPAAAFDGSTTGLSADNHRLVLAALTGNIPPKTSRLLVLNASLHLVKRLTLPGAYTVDAISPDGHWLYLLHYTRPKNLLRYEVRAYDLMTYRLLPRPVIDPREPDEAMRGTAATRVQSPDGRWAYTLYIRPQGAPFVHALDTVKRTAACIDLPNVPTDGVLHLALRGGTLSVGTGRGARALIDTRTFAVRRPATRRAPAARADHPRDSGGGTWPWLAAAAVAAAGLAALARRRRVAA